MIFQQTNNKKYFKRRYLSKQNQRKPKTILTGFVFDSRKFLFQNTPAFHQNTPAFTEKPARFRTKTGTQYIPVLYPYKKGSYRFIPKYR